MTVNLVFHLQRFQQTDGNDFQVSARQTAVSGKPLGQDQQVFKIFCQLVVVAGKKTSDIGQTVFFGTHDGTITIRKNFLGKV